MTTVSNQSKLEVFTPEEIDQILVNLQLEFNGNDLDGVITDLEHELYGSKFQTFFPKLSEFLTIGKIPQNEVTHLKTRFQSYFPHLSDLLTAGGLTQ